MAFSKKRYGEAVKVLTEGLPTSGSKTIFEDVHQILEPDVDIHYYMASGYWETLKRHKARQSQKGYGFGYCVVNTKDEALDVELLFHSSTPRSLALTLTFSLCLALDCSCSWESLRRREGLSFCLTVLAENSLKACVITSTSRPLKNTM